MFAALAKFEIIALKTDGKEKVSSVEPGQL